MTATGAAVPQAGGLGGTLKRGAALATIGMVLVQGVTVVQTLVLGRLLGPYEVGVYTAGSVLVTTLGMFAQGSLGDAIIQRKHDLEDAAHTAMAVTFGMGLLLALGAAAASPLIGIVFHDPRVGLIAAATSGLVLLHACPTVPDALMQRAFQFKRRIIIDPAVSMTSAVVAITFAALGYGAWALVIGTYTSSVVWVGLSWWLAKWHPLRGRLSLRIWREMARFSLPVFLEGIGERFREVFEQVLVGRWLGTSALGQYRYGYRIAWLPSMAVIQICSYVLFPAFSRISGDPSRFRAAFLRALTWIWFAALPVGALLLALGPPTVTLLLGEEWRSAGNAAAAMAGIGLGVALASAAVEAVKGAGRSHLLNWMTALGLGLGIPLLIVLAPYGLVAVGIALSISYLAVGFLSVILARPVVGFSARDIGACLGATTLAATVAFAVVFPLERFGTRSADHGVLAGLLSIGAECFLFAVIYLAALFVSPRWRITFGDLARRRPSTVPDFMDPKS